MTLATSRTELTVADLRREARRSRDANRARRRFAIALVLSRANADGLNEQLVEIARTVTPGAMRFW